MRVQKVKGTECVRQSLGRKAGESRGGATLDRTVRASVNTPQATLRGYDRSVLKITSHLIPLDPFHISGAKINE